MRVSCFLLLCFVTVTGYAQMDLEVPFGPEPLKFAVTALYPEVKAPMKSMVWVKDKDTLIAYELDKKGNLAAQHSYDRNNKWNTTTYSYSGKLMTRSVYTSLTERVERVTTNYKYTPSGKYLEWGQQRVPQHSLNDDFKWAFEYDKNDNLVKKFLINADSVKTLNVEYSYDAANRLKESMIRSQVKSVFEYDAKGNLVSHNETLNGSMSYFAAYEYDDTGNVVKQVSEFKTIDYSYEGGRLSKCIYTLYAGKEVMDFAYKDGVLREVTVQTDGRTRFIPFRLAPDYERSNGNKFRIEFLYDSHNNTRELKYYIDGAYKYSEKFIIEYY